MDHRYRARAGRRNFMIFLIVLGVVSTLVIGYFAHRGSIDVLSPVGSIGQKERSLILLATGLSLVVVVPVFVMTGAIAWRYRATNTRATYAPNWDHSPIAETVWWTVPLVLISILAVVAWRASHELDPNKAVLAASKPLTIQVIALQWRWLFLYPDQGAASLNSVTFPEDTPIHFEITADAPMNSFWIPKLGGQIYAMQGMATNLNLIANQAGQYHGSSANLSGSGFAGMGFTANAVSRADYQKWLNTTKHANQLGSVQYKQLSRPSTDHVVRTYRLADRQLFDAVLHSYMAMPETIQ